MNPTNTFICYYYFIVSCSTSRITTIPKPSSLAMTPQGFLPILVVVVCMHLPNPSAISEMRYKVGY